MDWNCGLVMNFHIPTVKSKTNFTYDVISFIVRFKKQQQKKSRKYNEIKTIQKMKFYLSSIVRPVANLMNNIMIIYAGPLLNIAFTPKPITATILASIAA